MRKMVIAIVALLGLPSLAAAQGAKIDLTGTWNVSVQTDAGTGTPTMTLKQDGDKLTGHYSSQVLGEADMTGTVKDKEIKITINVDAQGQKLEVVYAGTIEDKDNLKGTVDLGGLGSGTFAAKRK